MRTFVLASGSPRRREIFAKTGLPFEIDVSDYEEDMTLALPPEELAMHLSKGKAEAVAAEHSDAIIIAADTIVVYEEKALGKPKTEEKAREMLTLLNGRQHEIVTGVTILDMRDGRSTSFFDTTRVFMKTVPPTTIDAYIKTGEPLDKAGAYALQGKGAILIEKIEGDFFNAMGLPIGRLVEELQNFGVKVL